MTLQRDRAARALAVLLSLSILTIGLSGCQVLKLIRKSQKHAAIAYDENTGGWGYSYDHITEERAKSAATEKCKTCTVRLTWNQGCGALAQSQSKKGVMSAATGTTRVAAEGAAKAECLAKGAGPCDVVIWACNSK